MKDVIRQLEIDIQEKQNELNSLKSKLEDDCDHRKTWKWFGEEICLECHQVVN